MGHRANLVLLEKNKVKIYYSQWEGQKSSKILSQGLKFCERHFKKFNEDDYLMDNAWAEGGILIDKDKKKIMFFEIELLESGGLRKIFIEYLEQNVWIGWKIKWAFQGNVDFAEYLGLLEDRILADGCMPSFPKLEKLSELIIEEEEREYAGKSLITIITDKDIKDYIIYGFYQEINKCIGEGESLKDNIPVELETFEHEKIKDIEIDDVLLVDYNNKRLSVYWNEDVDFRHINRLKDIWKGWNCQRQTQGVIFNFEYTKRKDIYHEITQQEFNEYIKKWKLLEY